MTELSYLGGSQKIYLLRESFSTTLMFFLKLIKKNTTAL
tara:strand:- start:1152 stop:1268 length:117 start_codon:yes stop_codon:yes gene_type:complete